MKSLLEDQLGEGGDRIYEALMRAHEGLNEEESAALNARLILLLLNAVCDLEKIEALIEVARRPGH